MPFGGCPRDALRKAEGHDGGATTRTARVGSDIVVMTGTICADAGGGRRAIRRALGAARRHGASAATDPAAGKGSERN